MIDYVKQLKIDIDRLEHFEKLGDKEKVEEYKELIISDAKRLCEEKD